MRNKLLITAAIGTMMSTAVFAQSTTTGAPGTGAPGTATATPVPPAEQIRPAAPAPVTSRQEAPKAVPQAAMPPASSDQMGNNLMGTGHSGDQASAPAPRNFSTRASNIGPADTRSTIAPVLPTPPAGDSASATQLLRDARAALERGQTGLAQEAMERAEARVLSRSVPAGAVGMRVQGPVVDRLAQARHALGRNDIAASRALLEEALTALNRSAAN